MKRYNIEVPSIEAHLAGGVRCPDCGQGVQMERYPARAHGVCRCGTEIWISPGGNRPRPQKVTLGLGRPDAFGKGLGQLRKGDVVSHSRSRISGVILETGQDEVRIVTQRGVVGSWMAIDVVPTGENFFDLPSEVTCPGCGQKYEKNAFSPEEIRSHGETFGWLPLVSYSALGGGFAVSLRSGEREFLCGICRLAQVQLRS